MHLHFQKNLALSWRVFPRSFYYDAKFGRVFIMESFYKDARLMHEIGK